MRFNMGCGHHKINGCINVDSEAGSEPDQVWDLERTPWPWSDACAEQVYFIHSLEHMGADPKVFLEIMRELYRISAPRCRIEIRAPHPRHDAFIGDPTHVRPITLAMLQLFDRDLNDLWKENGIPNTPLAHYLGVNFKIVGFHQVVSEPYKSQLQRDEITPSEIMRLASERNNVIEEIRVTMEAR